MSRFSDKNVLITGASRGIGAGIAERMAAEGANVAIAARTVDEHPTLPGSLNATLALMQPHGGTYAAVMADLTSDEDRATLVERAAEAIGPIDILINNAAAAIYQPLVDFPLKRRRLIFEVNVHAPMDLMQHAIPHMQSQGEGWIINVSSGSATLFEGPPFRTEGAAFTIGVYGASKAALNRMSNAMAPQLHGMGIRINTIEPRAAVLSEGADKLVGHQLSEDQIESMEAMVESVLVLADCPLERTGNIEVSLDLLEELDIQVMNLQGTAPHPNGFRR